VQPIIFLAPIVSVTDLTAECLSQNLHATVTDGASRENFTELTHVRYFGMRKF
jgi:hypothetical protein